MKLFITRHGQSEWNHGKLISGRKDFRLTQKWIEQAQSLWKYMYESWKYIDVVYSWSLSRAQNTVIHIVRELWPIVTDSRPITYIEHPMIYERWFGDFEGKTKEEVAKKFNVGVKNIHHYLVSLPEAQKTTYWIETNKDIYSRAKSVLYDLLKDSEEQSILLVGHGWFNRALYYALHWMGEDSFSHDIDKELRFDHCSYSEIDIIDWVVTDIVINQEPV